MVDGVSLKAKARNYVGRCRKHVLSTFRTRTPNSNSKDPNANLCKHTSLSIYFILMVLDNAPLGCYQIMNIDTFQGSSLFPFAFSNSTLPARMGWIKHSSLKSSPSGPQSPLSQYALNSLLNRLGV